ncbi:MAG: hypothetical protein IPJ32_10145 [Sphingobacteriaceae bacterium]|nr:hypothetical protein [Sphingobacteriaceae bacterium]
MAYENGLPGVSAATSNLPVGSTNLGVPPTLPPITNSFSSDPDDRIKQDVGYDGMDNAAETDKFGASLAAIQTLSGFNSSAELNANFFKDPSSDDYNFFRDDDYDSGDKKTLDRYRFYNNSEGNSPTEKFTKTRTVEDILL